MLSFNLGARQIHPFFKRRDRAFCVRVSELTESQATALKQRWGGGSVSYWRQGDYWQWQSQGRIACAFMSEQSVQFKLHVLPRETEAIIEGAARARRPLARPSMRTRLSYVPKGGTNLRVPSHAGRRDMEVIR